MLMAVVAKFPPWGRKIEAYCNPTGIQGQDALRTEKAPVKSFYYLVRSTSRGRIKMLSMIPHILRFCPSQEVPMIKD
jgi:hypothetical protein